MKISFISKVFFVFLFAFSFPFFSHAASTDNMSGYAWSSNIGWVSFNCTNDSSCGTSNYGVNKDASGNLTGYAWSSNIGWIKFGGLAGFPGGSGTTAQNAQIVSGNLIGWAQALSNGGGWDGWISFTGTGYGVTQSGATLTGYAWGSSVIGWLSFDAAGAQGVKFSGAATLTSSGTDTNPADGQFDFGTTVTLSYTLSGLSGSTVCNLSKVSGSGSFNTVNGINTSGSQPAASLTPGPYTFKIDCIDGGISVASANTSFTVGSMPPGFIISGSDTIQIQFLGSGGADSTSNSYFVDNGGSSFSNPVTVSVVGISPSISATYSLNGGSFSSNPSPVIISSPYNSGISFKVHFTSNIGTTTVYTITLNGHDPLGGAVDSNKAIIVTPVSVAPAFDEH